MSFARGELLRDLRLALIVGLAAKLVQVVIAMVVLSFGDPEKVEAGFSGDLGRVDAAVLISALFLAPVVESGISLGLLAALSRVRQLTAKARIYATALLLTFMHGLSWASASVFPAFVVFAHIQLSRMRDAKTVTGFVVVIAAHFTMNVVAVMAAMMLY